ncbi:MAG: membrane integrity-associated transporter subunit PqiC [Deltaproteobacteria bacterium]|nr:membrane integrity-associated transporter subunit PqiC [Deltaproteobacteria bacterium]MBW2362013.1 membrane integrity-associated transporter subunit PqiC [Deltaproteobacteria bacterium]
MGPPLRRRPVRGAQLAVWLLAASLCACIAGPAPRDHFYRVEVAAPAAGNVQLPGTLEVERFASDDTLRKRGLLKSTPGSPEVTPYTYHRWVDSPTLLLQRALADYLRAATVAGQVVTPDAGATEDWQVTGYLRQLDFVLDDAPRVRVEIELRMRHRAGDDLVAQRIYAAESAAGAATPEAAARAFSLAIGAVFAEFTSDLRAAAAAH